MNEEQLGFALDGESQERALFDPDRVRQDARDLIAEARGAAIDGSWTVETLRYRRIIFPLLVSWLPDEAERDQLCFDFEAQAARIELLLAA